MEPCTSAGRWTSSTGEFEEQPYLDLEPLKGLLHEVACAAVFDDGCIVLDIF